MHDDEHSPTDANAEFQLPASMRAELREAFLPLADPSTALDERIGRAARDRVQQIEATWAAESRRTLWHRWRPVAAAAAILLASAVLYRSLGDRSDSIEVAALPTLDGSEEIDVLDAFQLARLLRAETDGLESAGWDYDGSGKVDESDIEALLSRAVRVVER